MAGNTLLTIDMITAEAVRIFKNSIKTKAVSRRLIRALISVFRKTL